MALRELQQLTHLNLAGNALGRGETAPLAAAISGLSNLQHLDLSRNDLDEDAARFLDTALASPAPLALLNLSWNRLGDRGAAAMAAALHGRSSLRELGLAGASIGPEGGAALVTVLEGRPGRQLEGIDLSSNALGEEGTTALLRALGRLGQLQRLGLNYADVRPSQQGLFGALAQCSRLADLSMAGNCLAQCSAATAALSKLYELRQISKERLRECCEEQGRRAMRAQQGLGAMAQCAALTRLSLAACSLGAGGVGWVASLLTSCPQLHSVALGGNGIGDAGLKALASSGGTFQRLQELDLAGNRLSGVALADVERALQRGWMPQLRRLNLAFNELRDEGMGGVCAVLAAATQLTHLRLTHNGVGCRGAHRLAVGMPACTTLQSLALSGNPFTTSDSRSSSCQLIEAGKLCPRLRHLDLGPMTPRLATLVLAQRCHLNQPGWPGDLK